MSSYIGRHAQLYDLFYAEKPYRQEAAFVHSCLKNYEQGGQRLLEVACGTGNHAFEFEQLGYTIVATDYSKDMLAQAQKKAKDRSSKVDFRLSDMRSLNLKDKPFDAAVCLFDSIGYALTNEAIINTFNHIQRLLKKGGVFILEFWHAASMIKNYEPTRVRQFSTPQIKVTRTSETQMDYANQLAHVTYTLALQEGEKNQTIKETQSNRYFLLQEMKQLLKDGGLELVKAFAGFRNEEKITDETWHIVAVAKKP